MKKLVGLLFLSTAASLSGAQSYKVTTFNTGGFTVEIVGVTPAGIVVGSETIIFGDEMTTAQGFKYDHGVLTFTNAPRAGNFGGTTFSSIDSQGNILGGFITGPLDALGGRSLLGNFLLNSTGQFSYFGQSPSSAPAEVALGINNKGEIVGQLLGGTTSPGFRISGGSYTLFSIPGFSVTVPSGVNDAGQIVGSAYNSVGQDQGFIYGAEGLQMVNVPNAFSTSLGGINDYGVAAGYYETPPSYSGVGFIYDHGTFTDVAFPNAENVNIRGITNSGVLYGSFTDTVLNAPVGFVATPLPSGEPSALESVDLRQERQGEL